MNDREAAQIVSQNLSTFSRSECLESLFVVTVEDCNKGGVDLRSVLAAMISAWSRLVESQVGRGGAVRVLRKTADVIERDMLNDADVNSKAN